MQKTTLYCGLDTGLLSEKLGGGTYSFPPWIEGKDQTIGLRLSERIDGTVAEVRRTVSALKVSLTEIDARPISGTWKIQYGNPASPGVVGANLTTALAPDISAADLLTALKALTDLASDYASFATSGTVDLVNGSWMVRGLDEDAVLTGVVNRLLPVSEIFVESFEASDEQWVQRIRLSQSAVAWVNGFEIQQRPTPKIEQITPGTTDGDVMTPDIQLLSVPAGFLGSFGIRRDDLGLVTGPLSFVGDAATDLATVQSALNSKLLTAAEIAVEATQFVVSGSSTGALIQFSGKSLIGVDQEGVLVPYVVEAAPGDLVFTLPLDRPELRLWLDSKASASPAHEGRLELQIDAVMEDVHDPEIDHEVALYRGTVRVLRDAARSDMATGQVIRWNHQHQIDAQPASIDSVITGEHSISNPFGDGVASVFVIDHPLASINIEGVTVYTNTEPAVPLAEWKGAATPESWADYKWVINNEDRITITLLNGYASSPPDADGLYYVITAAGPKSVYQDFYMPKEKVIGLTDTLATLAADIAYLKGLLGFTQGAAATSSTEESFSWPLASRFLVLRPQTLPAGFTAPAALSGFDPAASGLRFRSLQGAVANATLTALPSPLDDPAASQVGKAYLAGAADLTFPGGGIRAGDYALSDGNRWLRASRGWETTECGNVTGNATADTLTVANGTCPANGTAVFIQSSHTPPEPLVASDTGPQGSLTLYYVRDRDASGATCKLAATSGGGAIDLTGTGTGVHRLFTARDSYHPAEMEPELFEEIIEPDDLTLGSAITLNIGFEAAIQYGPRRERDRKTSAHWRFVLESGIPLAATSPGTPAANLKQKAWMPLIIRDFRLTPTPRPFLFGVTVSRSTANILTARVKIGRSSEAGIVAPNAGVGGVPFFLRGRFGPFDTADTTIEPAGLVFVRGFNVGLDGADDADLGKITIG